MRFVRPNVRAKRATTAWRAGQQAQNGPQAQALDGRRDMPLALRLSEGLGISDRELTVKVHLVENELSLC